MIALKNKICNDVKLKHKVDSQLCASAEVFTNPIKIKPDKNLKEFNQLIKHKDHKKGQEFPKRSLRD